MAKHAGYVVVEHCDDYEQILGLVIADGYPPGGVLDWTKGPRAMFPSRAEARAAIVRTDHYRLAFGARLPERKLCRIDPIVFAKGPANG